MAARLRTVGKYSLGMGKSQRNREKEAGSRGLRGPRPGNGEQGSDPLFAKARGV